MQVVDVLTHFWNSAVGPYSTIYAIWSSGELSGAKTEVPLWILGFLGFSMVVGLWTYGYKIMINLGSTPIPFFAGHGYLAKLTLPEHDR
jgi:phosphate/sulfate permease